MRDASSYGFRLCGLVLQLRCWVRVASRTGAKTLEGRWGQLLTMPTADYLEASGGPIPIREVEWVDLSASRVVGGIAGRPRQMVEIKDDILSGIRKAGLMWELRESTWSVEGVFGEEPVQLVRVSNPFGTTPVKLS